MLPYPFCDSQFFYQPIVNIATGEVEAYEALTRFEDPSLGNTLKAVRRIERLGLAKAFDQDNIIKAMSLLSDPGSLHGKRIMLNLSAESISSEPFVTWLKDFIAEVPNRHLLGMEITETMPIGDPVIAQKAISFLSQYGVRTYLDDVGSGNMSSDAITLINGYHGLKIDGSIIDEWGENEHIDTLVKGVLEEGRRQNACVTAEHLDSRDKIERAKIYGIYGAQGFGLGRPEPKPEPPSIVEKRFGDIVSDKVLANEPTDPFD